MTEPILDFVDCADAGGGHRMAYWQWGDPQAGHVVLCVHGLTRQGRDFDALANVLLAQAPQPVRIVCPDVVGRGRSDWLAEPAHYQFPQYVADMMALLAHLHARAPIMQFDHVGTSMGGLIGIFLAAQPTLVPVPVRRLVLNDVGPAVEFDAIARISGYVGQGGVYATVEEAAQVLLGISAGFGPHTPEQWRALTVPMLVPASERSADGRQRQAPAQGSTDVGPYRLHYDPALSVGLRALTREQAAQGEAVVWAAYDAVTAPTLLLRGADSDLLSRSTAQAMTQRGPRASLVEFANVGHAPTLVDPAQSSVVASFLFGP
ncbi:pimeloyl-ACP methyl ester carboxylesterase [Pseudacidovorax intermedius]|uniref:Pimeloyl-ACP methyl ester carboxylesterase n=1 Tax=Pseudacidovorax intermedius TaxID=433924 RepID=A0A370F4H2_9BURK|nr:alpha/beta fold hydrolase [Pseudacidovorax intermedius]RDI18169.1 pimeloyl-ACP methyl ester carboxylesterase [Pseudacidovorax intermedius]